jgi:hypothetical protein
MARFQLLLLARFHHYGPHHADRPRKLMEGFHQPLAGVRLGLVLRPFAGDCGNAFSCAGPSAEKICFIVVYLI